MFFFLQKKFQIFLYTHFLPFLLQSNLIKSLGAGELAMLGPDLDIIKLTGNPIRAVSDNAVAGLRFLSFFLLDQSPTTCVLLPFNMTNSTQLECKCAAGYSTEPLRPAFCGIFIIIIIFFYCLTV